MTTETETPAKRITTAQWKKALLSLHKKFVAEQAKEEKAPQKKAA